MRFVLFIVTLLVFGSAQDMPRFQPVSCRFETQITNVECGDLVVYESSSERTIQLHVAMIRARDSRSENTPILYISGGPGAYNFSQFDTMFTPLEPLYRTQDLIIFDQRGVGLSQPALDCPEVVDFQQTQIESELAGAAYQAALLEVVGACRARLVGEGIDLSAYNTDMIARDIQALRTTLGYDKWNLYATSYGTSVALTVMRDDATGIERVVLDSPLSIGSDWVLNQAVLAESALDKLFARCTDNAACQRRSPDLAATLYTAVETLNASPVNVRVGAPFNTSAVVDGNDLLQGVFRGLYIPSEVRRLPSVIDGLEKDDYITFATYELYDAWEDYGYSLGMNYSVLCAEVTANPTYTSATIDALNVAFNAEDFLALCRVWDVAPREKTQPLTSDIPTLLLVGEWDPIAPPETAALIAEGLSESTVVVIPQTSHLPSFNDSCARQTVADFFNTTVSRVECR